jgi:hypothetical protein
MSKAGRRALGRLVAENPVFASRFLESLAQAEPKQASQQQAAPQPAPTAEKATILDKITGVAAKNTLAKIKRVGAGAAGITLLYQAIDNLGDWTSGRDAASSAYGVITDNFTNWRAAVEPVADVLSSPLVALGAALGVGFLLGRKAWRQLKKSWKAATESVGNKIVLANEKVTERVKMAAEFAKSISKTAFAALTCYHLPDLIDAGRRIVEVEPNSGALSQLHQILNQFFTAAPGALIPVFAYFLAKATEWLMVSSVAGFLEPGNKRKKEKMLEEQRRFEAGQAETTAQAAPSAKPPEGPAPA